MLILSILHACPDILKYALMLPGSKYSSEKNKTKQQKKESGKCYIQTYIKIIRYIHVIRLNVCVFLEVVCRI